MNEDVRRRHDDPAGWRAQQESADDDWRGAVARMQIDERGRFVGWTFGELVAVVAGGLVLGAVFGLWLLEGLGVGLWELFK